METMYPINGKQGVPCALTIFLCVILSFAEATTKNFPSYQHPKHKSRTCYKCRPGFYKVKDCRAPRHNTSHPQWPTCAPCPESQISHGWNMDKQCWDQVPDNKTFVKSQVEIHPTGSTECGCPGATIEDETGNCVDAISMKDNLDMIKEIEESQAKAPCTCTEVIPPQPLCDPCLDRTEWLPSWVVGLIGFGLGLLIALGIFCIYQACKKCRGKVLCQLEHVHSRPQPDVCIEVTTDNTLRSQREETQGSMDIVSNIDDTNDSAGVHTRSRYSASRNEDVMTTPISPERPDSRARQNGHVERRTHLDIFATINERRQVPHHCSLPQLSCNTEDPVEWLRIPAAGHLEHVVATSAPELASLSCISQDRQHLDDAVRVIERRVTRILEADFILRHVLALTAEDCDRIIEQNASKPTSVIRAGFKEWREKNSKEASVGKLLISLQRNKRKALAEEIASCLGMIEQQGLEMPEDDDFDKLITICETSMNPESAREFFRVGLQLDNDVADALFQEDRNTFVRKGLFEWRNQRGTQVTPGKLVHLLREAGMEAVAAEICEQFELGEPDLIVGQSGSLMPVARVATGGSIAQAQSCDASATLSQDVEVMIPTSDAGQEASSILDSDESSKFMIAYDTAAASNLARETRQKRDLDTECGRVKHQDGSVECFYIDVENEAPDHDGKADPTRDVFESSRTSEISDEKLLKLTDDVTSDHETELFRGIGSPFRTGEIYNNESKNEYRPGAMAQTFLKHTFGNVFKSLKKMNE